MAMQEPTPETKALYDTVLAAIGEAGSEMDSLVILAVLAQIVGKWIAFCDAKLDPQTVMDMVGRNIELGNQQAIAQTIADHGGAN